MSWVEELKHEALVVNDLLTQYINLHNHYLKSAGTFSSLFKKVDFARLSGDAYLLFEKFRDERSKLEETKKKVKGDKEKEFAECLFLYTKSLTETAHLLFKLLHALEEKAKGNKLNFGEHMENDKKYQKSIETYTEYGQKLNILYSDL